MECGHPAHFGHLIGAVAVNKISHDKLVELSGPENDSRGTPHVVSRTVGLDNWRELERTSFVSNSITQPMHRLC